MKRVSLMKTMFLSALLCAMGFGVKAQTADAANFTGCDVIVRFYAVDPMTCATIATDAGPYTIPAGTITPISLPAAWVPGPPSTPYLIIAEVAYAACGFPGVLVGGGTCVYVPTAPLPSCPGCTLSFAYNQGPVFSGPNAGKGRYPLTIRP